MKELPKCKVLFQVQVGRQRAWVPEFLSGFQIGLGVEVDPCIYDSRDLGRALVEDEDDMLDFVGLSCLSEACG